MYTVNLKKKLSENMFLKASVKGPLDQREREHAYSSLHSVVVIAITIECHG